jgi:hypothetical protein
MYFYFNNYWLRDYTNGDSKQSFSGIQINKIKEK